MNIETLSHMGRWVLSINVFYNQGAHLKPGFYMSSLKQKEPVSY
jgi:hypothetical protein